MTRRVPVGAKPKMAEINSASSQKNLQMEPSKIISIVNSNSISPPPNTIAIATAIAITGIVPPAALASTQIESSRERVSVRLCQHARLRANPHGVHLRTHVHRHKHRHRRIRQVGTAVACSEDWPFFCAAAFLRGHGSGLLFFGQLHADQGLPAITRVARRV